MSNCPLCKSNETEYFYENKIREFTLCNNCKLIFVDKKFQLNEVEEKNEYDLHDNDVNDQNYINFLNRLALPVINKLQNSDFFDSADKPYGLDFGCGFAPALALTLERSGCDMAMYDKFYYPNAQLLREHCYDFITATEVVEHLNDPAIQLTNLWDCLKNDGDAHFLAIMTKLVKKDAYDNKEIFANWHYIRDLTHICFYSEDTMQYIAKNLLKFNHSFYQHIKVDFLNDDVIFFTAE
ncbi:methyltransferase domain-containing protein [Lentisphaerota bacterium WC36G]|nr:class I SAM-dependent methyltransferase [Lentisphaerae bacterium WC36]